MERGAGAESLSNELLDSICLIGPLDRCQQRLADYRQAGVDLPILMAPLGVAGAREVISALAGRSIVDVIKPPQEESQFVVAYPISASGVTSRRASPSTTVGGWMSAGIQVLTTSAARVAQCLVYVNVS
jgi:hypothetical protein